MVYTLSKAGTRHTDSGGENQDAVMSAENGRYCVIALADGVSEYANSKAGAVTVCDELTRLLLNSGGHFMCLEDRQRAELIVSHMLYKLEQRAAQAGVRTEEYSSTLACVLFDKKNKKLMYFSLGDSLILIKQRSELKIPAHPSDDLSGCPVTTTVNAAHAVRTGVIDASRAELVMICSDGAWQHMTDRCMIREDVRTMIAESDYARLDEFLTQKNCVDDCSYISIDLQKAQGRVS